MAMINRNDGLARCPIQSDGHDRLDPMTVMAALQAAKLKPQYSADQEYRDVNESPYWKSGSRITGRCARSWFQQRDR
jgi:hypothetical protein